MINKKKRQLFENINKFGKTRTIFLAVDTSYMFMKMRDTQKSFRIRKFIKITKVKINKQKLIQFLYIYNQQVGIEIQKVKAFTIVPKK